MSERKGEKEKRVFAESILKKNGILLEGEKVLKVISNIKWRTTGSSFLLEKNSKVLQMYITNLQLVLLENLNFDHNDLKIWANRKSTTGRSHNNNIIIEDNNNDNNNGDNNNNDNNNNNGDNENININQKKDDEKFEDKRIKEDEKEESREKFVNKDNEKNCKNEEKEDRLENDNNNDNNDGDNNNDTPCDPSKIKVIFAMNIKRILSTKYIKTNTSIELHTNDGVIFHIYFTNQTFAKSVQSIIDHSSYDQFADILIRQSPLPPSFSFDLVDEYKRMIGKNGRKNENQKISNKNENFELCGTYPPTLLLPHPITEVDLNKASKYRSSGGIPVIQYIHPKKRSYLIRSAQPRVGAERNRSKLDEKLLECFLNNNEGQKKIMIVDSRPRADAVANMLRGGGFENVKNYRGCELEFHNIVNLISLRSSLNSLHHLCNNITGAIDFNFVLNLQLRGGGGGEGEEMAEEEGEGRREGANGTIGRSKMKEMKKGLNKSQSYNLFNFTRDGSKRIKSFACPPSSSSSSPSSSLSPSPSLSFPLSSEKNIKKNKIIIKNDFIDDNNNNNNNGDEVNNNNNEHNNEEENIEEEITRETKEEMLLGLDIQKDQSQIEVNLEQTKWLSFIRVLLESAARIISLLHSQSLSVLVHCCNGRDRTAQTVALVEVMIEPRYRTMEGFLSLIEKEFFYFGHQFIIPKDNENNNEISPIFPQWMDAIFQLLTLFPTSFEFNETLLLFILEELYDCRFGVFLFQSMKERIERNAVHLIANFWTYLLEKREQFLNRNFKEKKRPIVPDLANIRLQLWSNCYLKLKSFQVRDFPIYERSESFEIANQTQSNPHKSTFRKKKKSTSILVNTSSSKNRNSVHGEDSGLGNGKIVSFIRGSRLTRSLVHSDEKKKNASSDSNRSPEK